MNAHNKRRIVVEGSTKWPHHVSEISSDIQAAILKTNWERVRVTLEEIK